MSRSLTTKIASALKTLCVNHEWEWSNRAGTLDPSLVNQPYFYGGGENTSGHTCTTLLAGRNFGYVIIQITLTAKTNFRYVKNVFTLRSKLRGTENKLASFHSTRSKSCLLKPRLRYAKAGL